MALKSGLERAEGPVVAVAHFNSLTQSLLTYATTKGRVHGWDLRSRKEAWLISNPLSHGIVQVCDSFFFSPFILLFFLHSPPKITGLYHRSSTKLAPRRHKSRLLDVLGHAFPSGGADLAPPFSFSHPSSVALPHGAAQHLVLYGMWHRSGRHLGR